MMIQIAKLRKFEFIETMSSPIDALPGALKARWAISFGLPAYKARISEPICPKIGYGHAFAKHSCIGSQPAVRKWLSCGASRTETASAVSVQGLALLNFRSGAQRRLPSRQRAGVVSAASRFSRNAMPRSLSSFR
jgi:hypothetical protein